MMVGFMVMNHDDNLEDFRDPQIYDLQDEGYYDDYPLTEQWARSLGGPLLDLACGTGRMALRMAALGYQVTGVDITPEMIARARRAGPTLGVAPDPPHRPDAPHQQLPPPSLVSPAGSQEKKKDAARPPAFFLPQKERPFPLQQWFPAPLFYRKWTTRPSTRH